jgi:hypothetical protein
MPSATLTVASSSWCESGGRLLLRRTDANSGEAFVDDTHRAGSDHAADEAREYTAPNPHLVGVGWSARPSP